MDKGMTFPYYHIPLLLETANLYVCGMGKGIVFTNTFLSVYMHSSRHPRLRCALHCALPARCGTHGDTVPHDWALHLGANPARATTGVPALLHLSVSARGSVSPQLNTPNCFIIPYLLSLLQLCPGGEQQLSPHDYYPIHVESLLLGPGAVPDEFRICMYHTHDITRV